MLLLACGMRVGVGGSKVADLDVFEFEDLEALGFGTYGTRVVPFVLDGGALITSPSTFSGIPEGDVESLFSSSSAVSQLATSSLSKTPTNWGDGSRGRGPPP